MEFKATKEQQAILDAELVPLKVIACAGSGKTATAVRRLVEVRRRMGASRGYAVLLSYSNVAVDTFRKEYVEVAAQYPDISDRVVICTADSFITSNILAPHAASVMSCAHRPFLVHGSERFLENKLYSTYDGSRPVSIVDIDFRRDPTGSLSFVNAQNGIALPNGNALKAVKELGKTGAYTHSLGRFWAMLTLKSVGRLANILARRFPHIIVDEAQDIGSTHGEMLLALEQAGSKLSLVGDPNQAIYKFADADGSFLKDFKLAADGLDRPITENRRSIKEIVDLSNKIAGTTSIAIRGAPKRRHGAFFLKYDPDKLSDLVTGFSAILDNDGYAHSEAAILARGKPLAMQLAGGKDALGRGATWLFADAAMHRDARGDIAKAFERTLDGTLRLIEVQDTVLRTKVLSGEREPLAKALRQLVWKFLRDSALGVPACSLKGHDWHAKLKARLPNMLAEIKTVCGLDKRNSWAMNVTKAGLGNVTLYEETLVAADGHDIRVSTVHRVKGESIPAVLYVTIPKSLGALLSGVGEEEGRIGYVAVTRAADLLIVAIPQTTKAPKMKELAKVGFTEWGAA